MKDNKPRLSVIDCATGAVRRQSAYYASVFEGPPPDSLWIVYVASDPVTDRVFTFAPVGRSDNSKTFHFTTRKDAQRFLSEHFPDVPSNFVSWASIRMLAAISTGVV